MPESAVRPPEDEQLAAIIAGDAAAFARWLAGNEDRLRASLRSFAERIDVEAVLQEALVRVWQVAPRFVPDGEPHGLLRLAIRIARNLAVSMLRQRRLEPVEIERLERLAIETDSFAAAPDRFGDPLLRGAIQECRDRLPEKPALALTARLESEGAEPDARVAERLRMRANTFLQNVVRARRFLADCPQAPRHRSHGGALMTERERLIEEAASAWRPLGVAGIRMHPAWADLDEAGRREAYEIARLMRRLEAALDADGLSTTARAVLARIGGSAR